MITAAHSIETTTNDPFLVENAIREGKRVLSVCGRYFYPQTQEYGPHAQCEICLTEIERRIKEHQEKNS